MQYHYFQNKQQLVIPIIAFQIEGKKCTPSFFPQSVVGQFSPKW